MTGKKTYLMGGIRREMDKYNTEFWVKFHCIIDQQSLCGKIWSLKMLQKMWCRLRTSFDLMDSHRQLRSL
jgi:hypothetical protein